MVGLLICITHAEEEMPKTLLFIIRDPHLTLHLRSHAVRHFRFRGAVKIAIEQVGMFSMSLFAFVIIHEGHEQKEINSCLAAFIDPPLEN